MPQETDRLKLPLPLGNENVTRESINGIFEKIDAGVATQADLDTLREAVSKMDIPDASLTQKGKVQLSDAINSTVKDKAATPSAVKVAYDEATAAKQLGVEQKNNVVAALNSIGVTASTSETWEQLILKMAAVIRATGTATSAQVLSGVPFSNASANGLTGTMIEQGAVSGKITKQNGLFAIPAGYHNGLGLISAVFENLMASNIRENIVVGGITGTLKEIRYATGEVLSSSGTNEYSKAVSGFNLRPYVSVSGLPFRPTHIILRRSGTYEQYVYNKFTRGMEPSSDGRNWNVYSEGGINGATSDNQSAYSAKEYTGDLGPSYSGAYVNETSFRFPVAASSQTYVWEAFLK